MLRNRSDNWVRFWVYFGNKEEHGKSKSQWISFQCYFFAWKKFFEMGKYGVTERHFELPKMATYPKKPINWRSTFSQCVFFTSAANPNDFGSLGTRCIVPADCFPSWLRLLVDDVELTGRIICCMLLKLGIFRNILTWTIFIDLCQACKGHKGSIETIMMIHVLDCDLVCIKSLSDGQTYLFV